jgi:putative ABC transport system ATP-binding protein
MLAVSCKNLKKTYGQGTSRVEALRGIDFDLEMGKLLMIVGPSGSGKTTLISIVAGILTQDEGECLLFNENLNAMTNGEKTAYRGKNIGFVFQAFNLVPMLSCKENIAVPLILGGTTQEVAEQKALILLEELGIGDKADKSPLELSGGQQQRVAIARSMIHSPKLIVCDEPTAYLDHETGQKAMHLLKATALSQDRALIVVTHDPRIFSFADVIIKLEDGKITS